MIDWLLRGCVKAGLLIVRQMTERLLSYANLIVIAQAAVEQLRQQSADRDQGAARAFALLAKQLVRKPCLFVSRACARAAVLADATAVAGAATSCRTLPCVRVVRTSS